MLIAIGLIAIVFKSIKFFLKAIYYFFYPDIGSIIKKDFDNDFTNTHKLLFVLVIMFIIVLVELILF